MCRGGGNLLYLLWSLTHCLSWSSLPGSHQQFSIIATYRPPATTIFYSTPTSSPEKKKPSSNRLGTHLSRGVEKPEGPSALQPTTEISPRPNVINSDFIVNFPFFVDSYQKLTADFKEVIPQERKFHCDVMTSLLIKIGVISLTHINHKNIVVCRKLKIGFTFELGKQKTKLGTNDIIIYQIWANSAKFCKSWNIYSIYAAKITDGSVLSAESNNDLLFL